MKIIVVNNLENHIDSFFNLLSQEIRADFIVLTGIIDESAIQLLKVCLIPVMIVNKNYNEKMEQFGWPICSPYGVIFDNNMRLIINGDSLKMDETINMAMKFRANILLSPEKNENFLEFSYEKNSGLGSIPEFKDGYLIIENFFNSIQLKKFETETNKKISEISFFW